MTPNQQCDRKYHTSSTTSKAEAPSALPEAAAMTQELTDIRYTRLRSTTAALVSRVKAPPPFSNQKIRNLRTPQQIRQCGSVPTIVLVMQRPRANHSNEIANEQSRKNMFGRQLHSVHTNTEPVKGAHEQVSRLWSEGIALNDSPNPSHRSTHQSRESSTASIGRR